MLEIGRFWICLRSDIQRLGYHQSRRGTASYRAPEVLEYKSNSRTDIFALGCIIVEIISTRKLFCGDGAVHSYAQKGKPIFPDQWPATTPGSRLHDLGELTSTLLSVEPRERPGATEILNQLLRLQKTSHSLEANGDPNNADDFFELENSDTLDVPNASNPTIPSGLRFIGDKTLGRGERLSCIIGPLLTSFRMQRPKLHKS